MSRTTQVPSGDWQGFRLRGYHPLWPGFPAGSANLVSSRRRRSFNPGPAVTGPVWAPARSLATTCAITVVFFSSGYLDVSVPRVGPAPGAVPRSPAAGCPIRKSVLGRVFAPGHGLSQLVTSFFASESQGILHVPFSPFRMSSDRRKVDCLFPTPAPWSRIRVFWSNFPGGCHAAGGLVCLDSLICSFVSRRLIRLGFQYVNDLFFRVENNGFEPLTPCLQSRCSSQLS